MKSISTVVEDIQAVLTAHAPDKNAVAAFGQSLAATLVDRLCDSTPKNTLRMSNFAQPDRKLWYTVNKPELAEPLSAEVRQKFLYGDIIEEWILFLAEQAGHTVQHRGMEVSYNGILGHIDAVIDGVVCDIKSASGRAFGKFANHELTWNDPFGYLDQLSLYVTALQEHPDVLVKTQGAFLAVDKESGRMCLDVYNIKKNDYEKELLRKNRMLQGTERPPRCYTARPHGTSGNQRLPMECSYCPFARDCWADSNSGKGIRSFAYAGGRVDLVNVVRVPEVPEIT